MKKKKRKFHELKIEVQCYRNREYRVHDIREELHCNTNTITEILKSDSLNLRHNQKRCRKRKRIILNDTTSNEENVSEPDSSKCCICGEKNCPGKHDQGESCPYQCSSASSKRRKKN